MDVGTGGGGPGLSLLFALNLESVSSPTKTPTVRGGDPDGVCIVGVRSDAHVWELMLAMLVMESAFGIAGLVAAPVFYAYQKLELAEQGLHGKPPSASR